MRFVVCGLLPLLSGCALLQAHGATGTAVPLVVKAEKWNPPVNTEAMILAVRMQGRDNVQASEVLPQFNKLVREIEEVLSRIRNRYPAMAQIRIREADGLNRLILALEPDLFERVSQILDDAGGPVPLGTGYEGFDRLNALFGLRAVGVFPAFRSAVFHYDMPFDAARAVRDYMLVEGVEQAEPDSALTDGPDIGIMRDGETWHVVFLDAWGDCPSGCLYQEHHFFIADSSGIESIDPVRARDMAGFPVLIMRL